MIMTGMTRRRLLAMVGAGALGAAFGTNVRAPVASAALADQYELIDLGVTGPAPRTDLGLFTMNDAGVAVGSMFIDPEKDSPWVFRDGELTRIKTGKNGARASSINSSGLIGGREIIGWKNETTPMGRPVIWIDGEKEVLPYPGGLPEAIAEGAVSGIADDGTVYGYLITESGAYYPLIWTGGAVSMLPSMFPEGTGWVNFVNRRGMAMGVSLNASGSRGVVWDNGSLLPIEYETVPGMSDWMIGGLDDADRLLGSVMTNGVEAAAWSDGPFGQPQVLPTVRVDLESSEVRCSDGANLLGGSITVGGKEQGVIWNNGEGIEIKSLVKNTKGLRLLSVERITSSGIFGGDAFDGDGSRHPV